MTFQMTLVYKKVPTARILSSPSGVAREDKVEERENFRQNYGITDVQTDVEFEIVF